MADALSKFPLGLALNFIHQQNFKTQAGLRTRARKIGVLITDGKSQDDVEAPSKKLKDEGVELFAVGELRGAWRWPGVTPGEGICAGKDGLQRGESNRCVFSKARFIQRVF